jgi:hypothetical protein
MIVAPIAYYPVTFIIRAEQNVLATTGPRPKFKNIGQPRWLGRNEQWYEAFDAVYPFLVRGKERTMILVMGAIVLR